MGNEGNAPGGDGAPAGDEAVKKLEKQVAELVDAAKSRDAENATLRETYERTNSLLQSMMNGQDRGGSGGGAPGGGRGAEIDLGINFEELGIPQKAAEALVQATLKVAEQRLDKKVVGLTQMAQSREKFYRDNPDLVGHEFLVGSLSQQVQAELPTAALDKQFTEVAKRTRDYIKRLQDSAHPGGDGGLPPVVGGGGNRDGAGAGGTGGDSEPENPDPNVDIKAEVDSRNSFRRKASPRSR